MTKVEIDEFKDEMKYYAWLKYSIELMSNKLEVLEYDMSGVKGVDYEKEKASSSDEAKAERRLNLIEEYNELLSKIDEYQKRLDRLDEVLDKMTFYEKQMFLQIYEERLSYQEVANRFYISKAGLFYRMNRVLERI